MKPRQALGQRSNASLRSLLLVGILLPVFIFALLNSASLYRQALKAADQAYDRTLLASAKSIGELLSVESRDGRPRLQSSLVYSALEAFEADNRSRLFFKVSGFDGEMVAGFDDLPSWQGELPPRNVYAALVHFYDTTFRGEPVRAAVLLQPVAGDSGLGMATIQVVETLELRRALARELLIDTVWRQAALLAVLAAVVVWVVQLTTQPVRDFSQQLKARAEGDLSPLDEASAPPELRPMVEATNGLMARLDHLLQHQKRFVRDTAHQLRTPLAVLNAQVQSARRGDVDANQALSEIERTVAGATELTNQMLALAKVEQLRQQDDAPVTDWAQALRQVALDMAPLMAEADIELDFHADAAPVRAHEWALREMSRNLLHNAVKYSRKPAALSIRLVSDGRHAALTVADSGPGIDAELQTRLFQPFARGTQALPGGAGLGLAISREIVHSLGGQLDLNNRERSGRVVGLDAIVRLPLENAT